jgi:cellulose biosynthesis protein BcsQ
MSLPVTTPAETLNISPEALEVANAYLQCQDVKETADSLDITVELVTQILTRREVKAYIDHVFMNIGFNNRFKIHAAMDAVLKQKFQELEESGMGSTKDIAELLALKHKMTMDELKAQTELEKLRQTNIKNQVNVQINDGVSDGSKYSQLIQSLLGNVQQSTKLSDE